MVEGVVLFLLTVSIYFLFLSYIYLKWMSIIILYINVYNIYDMYYNNWSFPILFAMCNHFLTHSLDKCINSWLIRQYLSVNLMIKRDLLQRLSNKSDRINSFSILCSNRHLCLKHWLESITFIYLFLLHWLRRESYWQHISLDIRGWP